MDVPVLKGEAVRKLWLEYKKTKEYKRGQHEAIPARLNIVEEKERLGLNRVIKKFFVSGLASNVNENQKLKERTVKDWMDEWKAMHEALFHFVYKPSLIGDWREKDVRFGNPGDEELYRIPNHNEVPHHIQNLAYLLTQELQHKRNTIEEKCELLAKVHYEFIRIHPFFDGNGRIARALTDQIALYYGLPPAVVGYPRHDLKIRVAYHKAIRACVGDPSCNSLSVWIRRYIEIQLDDLA